MKRLFALVAAALLVGGAVLVRQRLDDDGEEMGVPDEVTASGSAAEGGDGGAAGVIVCVGDVLDACRSAAPEATVRSVSAGEAIDALSAESPPADLAAVGTWVVPAFVTEAVEAERDRVNLPPVLGEPLPVAHAVVVPAGLPDRLEVLEPACGGGLTWACLAANADVSWSELGGPQEWGDVKVGADSCDTTSGLASRGALAVGAFGEGNVSPADYQELDAALADQPTGGTALGFLATRSGTYDVVGALEPDALAVARANPRVEVVSADSGSVVNLLAAGPAGGAPEEDLVADVRSALTDEGWAGGTAETNLPPGDVLAALRSICN